VIAVEADVAIARKGGHVQLSMPKTGGDSDTERDNADGM